MPDDSVPDEDPLSGLGDGPLPAQFSQSWKREEAPWSLLIWIPIPSCGLLKTSSKGNYLPKAPPPNSIILGVSALTHEFWRDTNTQSIILPLHLQ